MGSEIALPSLMPIRCRQGDFLKASQRENVEFVRGSSIISKLGAAGSPVAAVMNSVFFMLGISMAGFALGLYRSVSRNAAGRAGAAALFLGGIFMFLTGVFPCDPDCINVSYSGTMHDAVSILPVLFGILSMVLFGIGVEGSPLGKYRTHLFAAASLSVIIGYFYMAVDGPLPGLIQRGAVAVPLGTVVIGSLVVMKGTKRK